VIFNEVLGDTRPLVGKSNGVTVNGHGKDNNGTVDNDTVSSSNGADDDASTAVLESHQNIVTSSSIDGPSGHDMAKVHLCSMSYVINSSVCFLPGFQ